MRSPLPRSEYQAILAYQYGFTQPHPKYGEKFINAGWKTIDRPLLWKEAYDHAHHYRIIGSLSRHYPSFGVLDFDDQPLNKVQEIRQKLGFNAQNSVLFTSESKNSWHLYFKPVKNGRLVTIKYYLKIVTTATRDYRLEVYPHPTRFLRLPFGRGQQFVNQQNEIFCIDYKHGMELLQSIDDFELGDFPFPIPKHIMQKYQAGELDLFESNEADLTLKEHIIQKIDQANAHWKVEGLHYLQHGLETYHSRLDATKKIIYVYWAQNVPMESTIDLVSDWIQLKHNGYSRDYSSNPNKVLTQIAKLTNWIYTYFHTRYILPDSAHVIDKGFLTPSLVELALSLSEGSLSKLKFNLQFFAYLAPRYNSLRIPVHSDRLIEWSSTYTYLNRIRALEQQGIITRTEDYLISRYSKGIIWHLEKPNFEEAIKLKADKERTATTPSEVIPLLYSAKTYSQKLQTMGVYKGTITKQINLLYGKSITTLNKNSLKEEVKAYKKAHPKATQQEIAKELDIPLRTIKRVKTGTQKEETINEIKKYMKKFPQATHREIAQHLQISTKTIQRFLRNEVDKKCQMSKKYKTL